MTNYLQQLVLPQKDSHKGQNGKLLIIGGSELFHAPLLWAAEVASKVVDMVHVTSPYLLNDQLMEYGLKRRFWNGIVVGWDTVEEYVTEDDVVLIGPGMERNEQTKLIVDSLLAKYSDKKWVVDGGALQMVEVSRLNSNMVITPHHREWARLEGKVSSEVVVLLKGRVDIVSKGTKRVEIAGGNVGMTKGGTGDVLAGLVAALATKNDLLTAAVAASRINKAAGEELERRVGRFFNATDLVNQIPMTMKKLVG